MIKQNNKRVKRKIKEENERKPTKKGESLLKRLRNIRKPSKKREGNKTEG